MVRTHHSGGARIRRGRVAVALLSLLALLAASCAPTPAGRSQEGQPAAPKVARTLRLGTTREPTGGFVPGGGTATGLDFRVTFHSGLTTYDGDGNLLPRLAQKIPTIESGDWRLDPAGKMEVTWKLRPGIKWHDGTPLSVNDLILGWRLRADKELPYGAGSPWADLVTDVQQVDPQTFTVAWKSTYIRANESTPGDLTAVPEHILGKLYDSGDKQAMINSPYWTSGFVGLGPYRLAEYVQGSHMEAPAFDDYFLGRPKIDRLIFQFYTDANPLVASLLAGDIDFLMLNSIKTAQIKDIKNFWDPTSGGTTLQSLEGLRVYYLQYRDPTAPWVNDARVRRALVHSLDRQTMVDTLEYGLTTIGDTLPAADEPVFKVLAQKGFAKYPYDLKRAQQLLGEAGWTQGGDGKYRSASGQPFNIEVRTVATTPASLPEISAVSNGFNTAGFMSEVYPIPNGATNAAELRALAPGTFANTMENSPEAFGAFLSTRIATAQNGWRGNLWGYSNPELDKQYEQYLATMPLPPRLDLLANILKFAADDAIFLPMWYSTGSTNIAFSKVVKGPGPIKAWHQATTWNVHTWEMN